MTHGMRSITRIIIIFNLRSDTRYDTIYDTTIDIRDTTKEGYDTIRYTIDIYVYICDTTYDTTGVVV